MTPTIKLRAWHLNDIESLVKHANNPHIAQFMTNKFPYPYTLETGIAFINFACKDHPIHIFAIDLNGEAIGGIGIHLQEDVFSKNAELGYWLAEPYWGKGFMHSAIQQIIPFAFETYDINRIFARPFGNNIPSQKLLEKNHFILEAKLEKTLFKNGTYLDEYIYAIRKDAWLNDSLENR